MSFNLSDTKRSKRIRALLVGPTGRGKTIAAGSWPGKTLVIDFDTRHAPLIDWYAERVAAGDFTIELVEPGEFFTGFKEFINRLLAAYGKPYDNVILDGLTTMSTSCVTAQMMVKGAWSWKPNDKPISGNKAVGGSIIVPSWDEFNGEATMLSMLLEMLKKLDVNLFLTAHPVDRMAIDGAKGKAYTSLTTFGKKLESIVPTYFDEMWFFDYKIDWDNVAQKEVVKRQVYTRPTAGYQEAKTALKAIPAVIDITDKNLYDCVKDYL